MAAELLADLVAADRRLKASEKRLREAVTATGSQLMGLYGLGPVGSARLLADIGDIARFPTRARFASWNGTAPTGASSGQQVRHRLSRAGNRRINRVLHIMAIVQMRHDSGDADGDEDQAAEEFAPLAGLGAERPQIWQHGDVLISEAKGEEDFPGLLHVCAAISA